MKVLIALVLVIGVAYAANECHLIDCQNTYSNSKEADCVAVANWKACVERQTPEQDGLCTSLTIAAAKKVVYLAEKTKGCNSAVGVSASVFGSIIMAMIALVFRL
ncbi:hypothetical protein SNE40_002264 [Patella caerulea]|uniref:Uncharacterized protein n=1 Tax=Patella caerulea TaxID=87958 RepID=A0AAN8Q796_PATCE